MKGGEEAISDVGFFPAVAGRAYARIFDSREECSRAMMNFELFVVGSLGRGGISEAA